MANSPDSPRGNGDPGAFTHGALARLDERAGPARRLHPAVSAEMVRAILDRALDVPQDLGPASRRPPEPRPPPPVLARAAPPPRGWRRMLAAAAVLLSLLGVPGATAVAWHFRLIDLGVLGDWERRRDSADLERDGGAGDPPMEEVVVPSGVFDAEADGAARDEAGHPAHRRRVRRAAPARPRAVEPAPAAAPAPAPAATAATPAPAAAPEVVVPRNVPPENLLAAANELRRRRDWRAADTFYAAVVSRFGASEAAVAADVASASLHLVHLGDAPGALAAYQRALRVRPAGPLAEEARWGIAEAHRALGDERAEAAAIREFLAQHRRSALAPAAQRRLDRLEQ